MAKNTYYGVKPTEKKPKRMISETWKNSAWDIAKTVAGLAAGGCAATVANRYLKNVVPESPSTCGKIVTAIGVYFITGVIGNAVDKHVRAEMDDVRKAIREADEAVRAAREAEETENE